MALGLWQSWKGFRQGIIIIEFMYCFRSIVTSTQHMDTHVHSVLPSECMQYHIVRNILLYCMLYYM